MVKEKRHGKSSQKGDQSIYGLAGHNKDFDFILCVMGRHWVDLEQERVILSAVRRTRQKSRREDRANPAERPLQAQVGGGSLV